MSRADDPFDTYLLRVLCALVAERSVSRTAIKLNQSQPAISSALKRLRDIARDPLLVRDKGVMVPTARATELERYARSALSEIERLVARPETFDASTSQQTLRIGAPDYLAAVFLADVVEKLRQRAPSCRLVVHPLGAEFDYHRALAQGDLDIVIGNWPHPPENMHTSTLLEDEIVCLMSADHRYARGGMSVDQYLHAAHIVPVPYAVTHRGVVETHLATMRVKRDATVMLPSFTMGPYLLPGTDLIFTTSRHFADYYARFLPLAVVRSPIEFPRMRFYQLWHDRAHHSPAHRWLRALLNEARDALASPAGSARPRRERGTEPRVGSTGQKQVQRRNARV